MLGWVYDERTGWHFDEDAYARGRRVLVLGVLAVITTVLAGGVLFWVEAMTAFGNALSGLSGGEESPPPYGFPKTIGVFAVLFALWSMATAYGVRAAVWTVVARCLPAVLAIGRVAYGWAVADARARSDVASSAPASTGDREPSRWEAPDEPGCPGACADHGCAPWSCTATAVEGLPGGAG